MSEADGYNEDCEHGTIIGTGDNSNDENDVDDETMSGELLHNIFTEHNLFLISSCNTSFHFSLDSIF